MGRWITGVHKDEFGEVDGVPGGRVGEVTLLLQFSTVSSPPQLSTVFPVRVTRAKRLEH